MNRPGPFCQQLLGAARAYRLADRYPEMRSLLYLAQSGGLSEGNAHAILLSLEPLILKLERCPSTLPLAADQDEIGRFDVELGELIENPGTRIGIRLLDGPKHILVSGTTGTGKTTLLRQLIEGVDALDRYTAILVFGFKLDFDHLPDRLDGEKWKRYSFWNGFKQGTNAPRDLPAPIWFNQVAKILAARCGLIMSAGCLASIMRFAFTALNDPPGPTLVWPSLPLVFEIAKRTPLEVFAAKPDYGKTLIQALEALLGSSEGVFDALSGFEPTEHVVRPTQCCVIDLSMTTVQVSAIIVEMILSQLLYSRMYTRHTVDTTEVLVVIDEADAICSARASAVYPEGYSPLAQCLKQAREFGIMLCLGTSFIGQASPFIRANVDTYFMMNQSDPESLIDAARALRIPPGGEGQLGTLQPGECIYRSAQGRCSFPMLARIDYSPPSRDPAPESFDRHPYLPGRHLDDFPELVEALNKLIDEHRNGRLRQIRATQSAPSENARKLLDLASLQPLVPAARLWEQIGKVSPSAQANARAELEERKLASFEEERFGRRNMLVLEPTPLGWEYLGKHPPKTKGRGGLVHRHMAAWLKRWAEQNGYEAHTEWDVPGTSHAADVGYSKDSVWCVFEVVVTSTDNVRDHLHACFIQSDAVATVTIVAPRKEMLRRLQQQLAADQPLAPFLDRIRFEPMEMYMKELWP